MILKRENNHVGSHLLGCECGVARGKSYYLLKKRKLVDEVEM